MSIIRQMARTQVAKAATGSMSRRSPDRAGRPPVVLARAIAMMAIACGLMAAAPASEAHPFTFDTSKMIGFAVLTAEDEPMKPDLVVIEYDGPIVFPMAENLRAIWNEINKNERFERVLLRLNSPGGTSLHGQDVIDVLKEIRDHALLITLVGEHDLCASMCIPVYLQGETRYASPASSWMFHGASRFMSNIPSLSHTLHYFDHFKDRGVDRAFINFLFDGSYVTSPGAYWISGNELAARSNVITNLLPNWRPAPPNPGPLHGVRGGV
jgi:Clp protease